MAEMKPSAPRTVAKTIAKPSATSAAAAPAKPIAKTVATKPATAKPAAKPADSFLDDIYGAAAKRASEAPPPLSGHELLERREQERIAAQTAREARAQRITPIDPPAARPHVESSRESEETSSGGSNDMLWGAVWFIGGVAVTGVTYIMASESPTGGKFVVAYGAIFWGAVQFLKGLAQR